MISKAKKMVKDVFQRAPKQLAIVSAVAVALVAPEVMATTSTASATTISMTDVEKYISDAKLIAGGVFGVLVVLFGVKMWKRVFGGA